MANSADYIDSHQQINSELFENTQALDIIDRHMAEARVLLGTKEADGEALYRLTDALRLLRPSIIIGLARVSRDTEHMIALLRQACVAYSYPEMVEAFAGEVADGFMPGEEGRADTAYSLMMLAAAQKVQPDHEWQHIHTVTTRVAKHLLGDE